MTGDVCNTELTWRIDCVSQTRPNKSSFTRLPNHNANKSFLVLAFPTPQQQGDRMISNIYAQDVECLRLIYDRETYMYIENEKTQSFQIESPWRENVVTTLQMGGTSTLTKLHKT
jgi:hypothetical protein